MRAALWSRMARRYDEFDAWQLANELKLGVYKLTECGSVTRDFDFYRQLAARARGLFI